MFTSVYGSPHSQFRIDLWRELRKLVANMVGSWSIMGDFNAVIHDYERQGGSQLASYRGDLSFREMVYDCNLVDMGFQGNPFTWKKGNLLERLDRVLANMEWKLKFPHANVFHLHRLKSDHCPLL
uniref:Endonuclease/exonuclease/phosphatase domain-containing protein n=1 Tax=Cajanus cajan TaxID=3821 RepID=A0A151SN41_CAJCA|nr:hypothetical protein KK1_002408 [Cajanus cajan]